MATGAGFMSWGEIASQRDAALIYSGLLWRVFTVNARKEPVLWLVPHWSKDATTDPAVIDEWWGRRARHAGIGLAISVEIVVVDADVSRGQRGIAHLEQLAGMKIDDIQTPIATTPSGGRHVFFSAEGRVYTNARIKGTSIDVKGCGLGYVVLPGFEDGRAWIRAPWEIPFAPAPTWLDCMVKRELSRASFILTPREILERTAQTTPSDPQAHRRALITLGRACALIVAAPPGERNDTRCRQCFFIGGLIGRGDLDYPTAYEALLEASCAVEHDPPWPRRGLEKWVAQSIAAGMTKPLPPSETEQWMRDFRARQAARRA
jgi:hypothetical protein